MWRGRCKQLSKTRRCKLHPRCCPLPFLLQQGRKKVTLLSASYLNLDDERGAALQRQPQPQPRPGAAGEAVAPPEGRGAAINDDAPEFPGAEQHLYQPGDDLASPGSPVAAAVAAAHWCPARRRTASVAEQREQLADSIRLQTAGKAHCLGTTAAGEAHYAVPYALPGAYHTSKRSFCFVSFRPLLLRRDADADGPERVLASWCAACPCHDPSGLDGTLPYDAFSSGSMTMDDFFPAGQARMCSIAAAVLAAIATSEEDLADTLARRGVEVVAARATARAAAAEASAAAAAAAQAAADGSGTAEDAAAAASTAAAAAAAERGIGLGTEPITERLHSVWAFGDYTAATNNPSNLSSWGMVKCELGGVLSCTTCVSAKRFCPHVAQARLLGPGVEQPGGASAQRRMLTQADFDAKVSKHMDLSSSSGGRRLTCLSREQLPEDVADDDELSRLYEQYSRGLQPVPGVLWPVRPDEPCTACSQAPNWSQQIDYGPDCVVYMPHTVCTTRFGTRACLNTTGGAPCSGRMAVDGKEYGLLRKSDSVAFSLWVMYEWADHFGRHGRTWHGFFVGLLQRYRTVKPDKKSELLMRHEK